MINYSTFMQIEIHVGTIIQAEDLPAARVPAFVLTIDFGPLGLLKSTSQITNTYTKNELIGKQVYGVTNLEPKQVGKVMSQCLVLGTYIDDEKTQVVLSGPDRPAKNGARLL